jgi:hypothetical protein
MAILFGGGEDLDFAAGSSLPIADTTSGRYRSSYARCDIGANTTADYPKSIPFAGGAVTSAWLSCQFFPANSGAISTGALLIGLINSSTASSGLWFATSAGADNQCAIAKFDGTTITQLVAESGNSITQGTLYKIDLEVISYGASGTANLYVNGSLVATYTGNVAVSGVTNLNAVAFQGHTSSVGGFSEMIVASEDTRAMSLCTTPPTGAGSTDQWTGSYADVNEVTINDSSLIYTNTTAQDEQFTLGSLPSGTFAVRAVIRSVRASSTAGATATQVAPGFNISGTVYDQGLQSTTTSWETLQALFTQNPATSANWAQADITGLQSNDKSG